MSTGELVTQCGALELSSMMAIRFEVTNVREAVGAEVQAAFVRSGIALHKHRPSSRKDLSVQSDLAFAG